MKVLIFELDPGGHRLNYVRTMLPGLSAVADEVVLALSSAAPQTVEYKQFIANVKDCTVDASLNPLPAGLLAGARTKLRSLRQAIAKHQPAHVYIPYGDGLAQILGIPGAWRWAIPKGVAVEVLMLRGGFAYPLPSRRSRITSQIGWALASRAPWYRLYHLDPLVLEHPKGTGRRSDLRLMPDPVEAPGDDFDRLAKLRSLGLGDTGRYTATCSIFHGQDTESLIRAFAAAPLTDSDRLVILGRVSPALRAMLDGEFRHLVERRRLCAVPRFLSGREIADAFAAMDLVCVPRPIHIGSSSMVIRAAAASRPVLASNFGWTGYVIPRFNLGHVADLTNPARFSEALASALQGSKGFRLTEAGRRFAQFHSPQNFQDTWEMGLRGRLGLPTPPDVRTWEWVLNGESSRASAK